MAERKLLSEREKEVAELLLQGKSNKQIAVALAISERTVEFHLKNIYTKLRARSRAEAILRLGKSTGIIAEGKLWESTVEETSRSSENVEKSVPRRLLMKKSLVIIGLGTALVVALCAGVLLLLAPVKTETFQSIVTVNSPFETPSAPVTSPTSLAKGHILAQIRQLAAEYDQAVQAEKKNGNVKFSKDPKTGEDIFLFEGESYVRILDFSMEVNQQINQLIELYVQEYRDEIKPTPFPTQSSAEEGKTYYEFLLGQLQDCVQQQPDGDAIRIYDPDLGTYRSIHISDATARCEVYGRMIEEWRVAPLMEKVNKDADMALIRQIMGEPDLRLTFQSVQGLANAPGRNAALYTDETGAKYYVDIERARLAAIEPNFVTHPEIPAGQMKSMDELRGIALQFARANSPRLAQLNKDLLYEEGCKGNICFFRWDTRKMDMDWSGTDWAIMPPFLQVGMLTNGQIVTYINTLDLFEATVPVALPQPTPQAVLGGGTVEDGPFIFVLYLFRDPTMTRQPLTPSLYSDLEGIGAWMYWYYKGADVIGPLKTWWGILPHLDQLLEGTYASVKLGESGGRNGGVLLPGGPFLGGESKVGDHVQVVLKVTTPEGDFGAVLIFTLKQGVNGFEPTDITVKVLP